MQQAQKWLRGVYERHKDLFFFVLEVEDAVKLIAVISLVRSILAALLPLSPPFAWVFGGVSDLSMVLVSLAGSLGTFFAAVGCYAAWSQHPGYIQAFQLYLIGRVLATIPVFVLDRVELAGCEGYATELMHRIRPNLQLRRVALDGHCEGARTFVLYRWLVYLFLGGMCIRCVNAHHEELYQRKPYDDIFEDPVAVFQRLRAKRATSAPDDYGAASREQTPVDPWVDVGQAR